MGRRRRAREWVSMLLIDWIWMCAKEIRCVSLNIMFVRLSIRKECWEYQKCMHTRNGESKEEPGGGGNEGHKGDEE